MRGIYFQLSPSNIVVNHPIIKPVEGFYETSNNKKCDAGNLSQNTEFSTSSRHSDKSHAEIKSEPEINLDKSLFDDVADNAINQMVVLTEKTKSLQSQLKELFAISKNEESITTLSKLSGPRMTNKRHNWKKGTALMMGDSCLSGLCQ